MALADVALAATDAPAALPVAGVAPLDPVVGAGFGAPPD